MFLFTSGRRQTASLHASQGSAVGQPAWTTLGGEASASADTWTAPAGFLMGLDRHTC